VKNKSEKPTNNVKNILFTSISARFLQNKQKFLKDCFVIRRIVKMFHRDVQDKMAANGKLSPQYYGVAVILYSRLFAITYKANA
jgi:hypothetical protein